MNSRDLPPPTVSETRTQSAPSPRARPARKLRLLMMHGIWNTGAVFAPMRRFFSKHGYETFAPSLVPNDAALGIVDLALKLRDYVEREFGPDEPLVLVGFSMGCIVSRYYLQHLGGHRRVRAFFAISGPHRGTLTAYCYPRQGARDMRPGSELLKRLDASEATLSSLRVVSYWTPFDLTIVPAAQSRWKLGRSRMLLIPFHPLMPWSRTLHRDILGELNQMEAASYAR